MMHRKMQDVTFDALAGNPSKPHPDQTNLLSGSRFSLKKSQRLLAKLFSFLHFRHKPINLYSFFCDIAFSPNQKYPIFFKGNSYIPVVNELVL